MKSELNCGVDLGRTIVSRDEKFRPFPNCFEVLKEMVLKFNEVYIVSRVNSEQKLSAEKWLEDNNFYNLTGFKRENVYFCFERADKAIFVKGLDISIFIDDRPDVLVPMRDALKLLYNPSKNDLLNFSEVISKDMKIVNNWSEVRAALL